MGFAALFSWVAFHASVFYGTKAAFSYEPPAVARAVGANAMSFVHDAILLVVAPWAIAGRALDFASPNSTAVAVVLVFSRAFFSVHNVVYAFSAWKTDPKTLVGNLASLTLIGAATKTAGGPALAFLYMNAMSDAVGSFARFAKHIGSSYRLVDSANVAHAVVFVATRAVFSPLLAVNFFAAGVNATDASLRDRAFWALAPLTTTIAIPFVACELFDEARIF